MRKPILPRLGEAIARQRQRLLAALLVSNLRNVLMTFNFLDGFKTYLVAAAMIVAALSQLLGVHLPSFDGQSAGHLLMEGWGCCFCVRGSKGKGDCLSMAGKRRISVHSPFSDRVSYRPS